MKKLLIFILLVLFLYFGGYNFLRGKFDEFSNPPRDKMLQDARFFGDFSHISSDYVLKHTLGAFNYKFLTILHKPSGQKIIFMSFGDKNFIKFDEFNKSEIDILLQNLTKNDLVANFLEKNSISSIKYLSDKDKRPVKFSIIDLKIKNLPVKSQKVFLGIYNMQNAEKTVKKGDNADYEVIILSLRRDEKFSSDIVKNIIQKTDF